MDFKKIAILISSAALCTSVARAIDLRPYCKIVSDTSCGRSKFKIICNSIVIPCQIQQCCQPYNNQLLQFLFDKQIPVT